MNLFTPKHQRLVNQCYPTGKTPEKKPKSSETSYLLYYVNSRRTKLEKVSNYLLKKTARDLTHRRIGNIAVTLQILARIITSCKENLNVFLYDFLTIMVQVGSNTSMNNDATIVECLAGDYHAICDNLDISVINNNDLHQFEVFTNLFFQICSTDLKGQAFSKDDLTLKGCIAISLVKGLASNPKLKNLISEAIYKTLLIFQSRHKNYQTADISVSQKRNNYNERKKSEDVINKKISLTRTITRQFGLDDIRDDSDLSIISLKHYYNTLEAEKLPISVRALLKVLLKTPNKELLEFITNGIPVQLRYIVIIIFISELSNKKEKEVIIILQLISSLVYTEVSIVGLSVLDTVRKLLNYQTQNKLSLQTIEQCKITIADLNTRLFYKDQTSDILQDIYSRLKSIKNADRESLVQKILITDIDYLVALVSTPCISLDLFTDIAKLTFPDCDMLSLLRLVNQKAVTPGSMTKFFKWLSSLNDEKIIDYLMNTIFRLYGSIALLVGLLFYQKPSYCKPYYAYYKYHIEAAKFLSIHDYEVQSKNKMTNNDVFHDSDLLNYYSDSGANKYASKGTRILAANNSGNDGNYNEEDQNNSDLMLDRLKNSSSTTLLTPVDNGSSTFSRNNIRTNNFNNSESKSFGSLKYHKPTVKELRKTLKHSNTRITSGSKVSLNGSPRTNDASQSLKSRITNITFLLSDLQDDLKDMHRVEPNNNNNDDNNSHNNPSNDDFSHINIIDQYDLSNLKSQVKPLSIKGDITSINNNDNSIDNNTLSNGETATFRDASASAKIDVANRGKIFE
ncbi:related to Protein EFR3 [Saccharomycodes ludwigii]|uniref:Protein EFR3 n=1 Tax=Saccharomycodes ludwigii TaxID=36035 RepID=A0A376B9D0_9ASCO|nr:hypothetical protein SCDLUD_002213 [Saccharomycodes ludwigii]KAH3902392.1 hypothetical protein SCDLUD_002213 [Saccharomycodes ludwigii]SSD61298.1 related to Protein EFR3 [Saccharomycodes ludwigii]